jgi:hypothetical protein
VTESGDHYCPRCVDDGAVGTCADCGEWFPSDELQYHEGACESFCADHYPSDDDDCEGIGDYHDTARRGYRPVRGSYRGPLLIGLELEIERGSLPSVADLAARIRQWDVDAPGTSILAGIDRDSSVPLGAEAILHPCSLDVLRTRFGGEKERFYRAIRGAKAHDTTTCGLHVNLSRAALLPMEWRKFDALIHADGRVFEGMWDALFRRADPYYAAKAKALSWGERASRSDRYRRANFGNAHRVEVRAPKGTIRDGTIIRTCEALAAATEFVRSVSLRDFAPVFGPVRPEIVDAFVRACFSDPTLAASTRAFRQWIVARYPDQCRDLGLALPASDRRIAPVITVSPDDAE